MKGVMFDFSGTLLRIEPREQWLRMARTTAAPGPDSLTPALALFGEGQPSGRQGTARRYRSASTRTSVTSSAGSVTSKSAPSIPR